MNKLNKDQTARHNTIGAALSAANEKLQKAIEVYNAERSAAYSKVSAALEELNTELNTARELRDEVVSDMDGYTSERSEKWAESDAAQEFESWQSAWEGLELEDVEIDEPEDLEAPDVSIEDFEGAPTDKGMA